MSEFTKGKWEVVHAGEKQYSGQHFWGIFIFSGAKPIAKITQVFDDNDYSAEANACLIASAPEMYEALKTIIDEFPIIAGDSRHDALFLAVLEAQKLLKRIDGNNYET